MFSEYWLGLPLRAWLAGVFGLAVGSFLNVVVHRLPRGQSIVHPGSRCPRCGHVLRWYENVPLASWFLLWGRCRACRAPISIRYPLVEAATGILLAAVWALPLPWWSAVAWSLFVATLLVLALIDLEHYILPDVLTLPLVPLGFVVAVLLGGRPLGLWVVDVVGGPLFLLALRWFYFRLRGVEGIGLGDVKLLAAIGAWLGWPGVVATVFVGSLVGSLVGIVVMLLRGGDLRLKVPFGPFLVAGAYVWTGLTLSGWAAWLLAWWQGGTSGLGGL